MSVGNCLGREMSTDDYVWGKKKIKNKIELKQYIDNELGDAGIEQPIAAILPPGNGPAR